MFRLCLGVAMEDNLLRYTLRIDRLLFKKFRYVAEYNGHSANREIEQFIKIHVHKFETLHGQINFIEAIIY